VVGRFAYMLLKALGAKLPQSVIIGRNFQLVHGGIGTVIHPRCEIGENVAIFQGVTIGRGDFYRSADNSPFRGIKVEDDIILRAGAKILGSEGVLQVATGTIVGANAVLLKSTNPWEIWAGVPARCIGLRDSDYVHSPVAIGAIAE
jgi:serine O-acetyltransferase